MPFIHSCTSADVRAVYLPYQLGAWEPLANVLKIFGISAVDLIFQGLEQCFSKHSVLAETKSRAEIVRNVIKIRWKSFRVVTISFHEIKFTWQAIKLNFLMLNSEHCMKALCALLALEDTREAVVSIMFYSKVKLCRGHTIFSLLLRLDTFFKALQTLCLL